MSCNALKAPFLSHQIGAMASNLAISAVSIFAAALLEEFSVMETCNVRMHQNQCLSDSLTIASGLVNWFQVSGCRPSRSKKKLKRTPQLAENAEKKAKKISVCSVISVVK